MEGRDKESEKPVNNDTKRRRRSNSAPSQFKGLSADSEMELHKLEVTEVAEQLTLIDFRYL
jgi:hypothetical protein